MFLIKSDREFSVRRDWGGAYYISHTFNAAKAFYDFSESCYSPTQEVIDFLEKPENTPQKCLSFLEKNCPASKYPANMWWLLRFCLSDFSSKHFVKWFRLCRHFLSNVLDLDSLTTTRLLESCWNLWEGESRALEDFLDFCQSKQTKKEHFRELA